MSLEIIEGYKNPNEVIELFTEYTQMLIEKDSTIKKYLDMQNYEEEIKHLETKYGLPHGRLYLAILDENLAGCIALRKIDQENCEMKRLYVRPNFRGNNIGEVLVKRLIDEAKEIGYKYMLLDTLPYLQSAIKLYRGLGFYEIGSYNDTPIKDTIFMRYDLGTKEP